MLPLLLLLVAAQVPPVPGETTLVSFCKQGRLSACEELQKINPELYAKTMADLAKAGAGKEVLRIAEEAREGAGAEEDEGVDTAPEPPDCRGQEHHIISRKIAKALDKHKTLRGLYKPRDERYVAQAKDEDAHCGYQDWHRKVDEEVIRWLDRFDKATPEEFIAMLRELYRRKEMGKRFPNGF